MKLIDKQKSKDDTGIDQADACHEVRVQLVDAIGMVMLMIGSVAVLEAVRDSCDDGYEAGVIQAAIDFIRCREL